MDLRDDIKVFQCIANCEISTYTTMYPPQRAVISTGETANACQWTKYRVQKAIKLLREKGLIERASCGCPAVESVGEYRELVHDAMPPKNGYALSQKGFESDTWKEIYVEWCRSMEEWANGKGHKC